jgi:hypothetical protein
LKIEPSTIEANASQIQGIDVAPSRAAEIAVEVEGLLGGLEAVLPAVDFFDEPESFRAALWALRERGPEGGHGE